MIQPMLAMPSNTVAPTVEEALDRLCGTNGYLFDAKWDGVRAIADIDQLHGPCLWNRNGMNITERYPDVAAVLAETFEGRNLILDGEIITLGADGRPDFNRLSRRDRQTSVQGAVKTARTIPVIYVAFDILAMDGADFRDTPLKNRLNLLSLLRGAYEWDTRRLWLSPSGEDGRGMWEVVKANNLEGLIAKNKHSHYRGQRDSAWIKLKVTHRVSCIVTGWEEGKGTRAGRIGALLLSLYDENGDLVQIGKAGTGLNDADLATYLPMVQAGSQFVVEVEYGNLTKDGKLRFPSHKGIRTDVARGSCTTEQLKE